ncbi:hypothetical protein A9Q84_03275 [Halobacteriovorax marinus]|uniref:Integrase catalytic domain-containing protein n=1 Tax=Halobacteriovorax marinus TaxID=97084 RepID=A0A1Y5FA82_9BACT|nr:hypothetical protein A9Q84_03275 [Halobacteriovorax marinus]
MIKNYKKYDDYIIEMIVKSGNPNLFPELSIPRSTAIYWINKSKKKITLKEINYNLALEENISVLEAQLRKEKSKVMFLKTILVKLTGFKDLVRKKKNKEVIVDEILEFSKFLSKAELCRLLGLQDSTFHKFKIETKGCEKVNFKRCKIRSPNQLTFREQEKIFNLANDPKLSYMSIKGLQYHAFRKGILSCSYDSWRKYVHEFRGKKKKIKEKKYKVGVRASRINEIWHMDITEFKLKGGGKAYLQVVVDNYSRKIVSWKLENSKSCEISIKNILNSTLDGKKPQFFLTDGGGENIAKTVRRILTGKGITALVAKKDVLFSNSMVESFFRILKKMFICKYRHYRFGKLYRLISRAIILFNDTPLGIFHGAKPNEIYDGSVDQSKLIRQLAIETSVSRKERPLVNRGCFRQKCG